MIKGPAGAFNLYVNTRQMCTLGRVPQMRENEGWGELSRLIINSVPCENDNMLWGLVAYALLKIRPGNIFGAFQSLDVLRTIPLRRQ